MFLWVYILIFDLLLRLSVSAFSGGTCLFAAAEGEETKGREQVIVSDYVGPVCSPGVLLFDGQFGPSHPPTADHVPLPTLATPWPTTPCSYWHLKERYEPEDKQDTMPAVTRPPHPYNCFFFYSLRPIGECRAQIPFRFSKCSLST